MKGFSFGKGRGQAALRALGSLIALGLLVYLLSRQGWGEILDDVRRIRGWRLALALGLMLVSRLAVAGRWHVLLHSAHAGIPLRQSLRLTFAGLFAANFLPTTVGGDVVRLAGAVRSGAGAGLSAASLVVDRLVGMAGMAMTLPLGLGPFLSLRPLNGVRPPGVGTAAVPFLGGLGAKAGRVGRRMLEAARLWARQPGALLLALLCSWVHMLCTFYILTLLFTGMGERISLATTAGLYSLVYFVTLVPISINGYGLQELSLTYLFAALGGVSESSAISAALLFRTLMMLASLPGAAFLPGLLPGAGQPPLAGTGTDGQPEPLH